MLADAFSPSTLEAEAGSPEGSLVNMVNSGQSAKTLSVHNTGQILFVNNSFEIKEKI